MEVLQRPGGELATRPIHFFWVVDCSGSMYGEKIGIVNNTIQECIPEMRSAADNNPNAQLLIRALQFSSGASWITSSPVPVEDYGWEDMDANGLTELGKAFDRSSGSTVKYSTNAGAGITAGYCTSFRWTADR